MTRDQLHRAVARATGEDFRVLMSRGFSLVDDVSPLDDSDLAALIADWELIESEEMSAPYDHAYGTPLSRIPTSRTNKVKSVRKSRANRSTKGVRVTGTAN